MEESVAQDTTDASQDWNGPLYSQWMDAVKETVETESNLTAAPESVASETGEGASVEPPRTSLPATGPEQPPAQNEAGPTGRNSARRSGNMFVSVDGKRQRKQKKHHDE